MSKYKRACSWSPFHYVKTWYMDVKGIWLRFWCSGFALQGFDQIMRRKSTPQEDEELNLFADPSCIYIYICMNNTYCVYIYIIYIF